jgi:DNA polymerase-3 subunit delta'
LLSKVREQDEAVAFLTKVVEGKLTSPLLLVGDEGVGRRFSAIEAIKDAFSDGDPNSNFCLQVDQRMHPDFTLVTPEGDKELGVEAVREVIATAYDYPLFSKRKFFVVDGVDRMTSAAANAFLKTLEEPPERTQFLLLAETVDHVLPTIRSRCGKVRYKRLSETFIVEALKDFVSDPLMAAVYARLAEGSLGRAFQYFGSSRINLRNKVFSWLKIGLTGDLSSLFSAIDGLKQETSSKKSDYEKDLKLGLRFLEHLLYDLSMLPHDPSLLVNLDLADELGLVGKQLKLERVRALQQSVRTVQSRSRATHIQYASHVKAALGSVFCE